MLTNTPIHVFLHNTGVRQGRLNARARRAFSSFPGISHVNFRTFATNRNPISSSLLTNALDQKQRSVQREDSVGPFQLGLIQPTLRTGEKPPAKWSELSTSGKVTRTAERTTNLTVILLGAGLSAILLYALTSELFSKNSPTVLYGEACERIKKSTHVSKYFQGPLSFHNTPSSAIRPRHRNHHVSSQIFMDSNGREHMILNFYVQGSSSTAPSINNDMSYLDSMVDWAHDRVEGLNTTTLDETMAWSQERISRLWANAKGAFRYLSGAPLPPLLPLPSGPDIDEGRAPRREENTAWSFAGLFSSLRGQRRDVEVVAPDGKIWNEGEVHADLIRNDQGYFVFRYLLIDIPSSRNRRSRVFVEQGPGVRHDESIMRWHS